jgi:NADH-quinone oxidoreductase subunit N
MLYGISLVYGLTGTMNITEESLRAGLLSQEPVVLYTALFMVFGGLLFKLALVPFHAWAPDVYEATPTPLVAFLSVGPKVVVLVVAMRLLSAGMTEVRPVLGVLALLSMTAGNAMALGQQQARRLLGYSSIAQAGYLLVGVLAYSTFGLEAALFYVLAYALLNIAVFVLLDLLQPHSPMLLSDYEGLGSYAPWPSIALTVALVGLAGLPPTVGFTAKWFVFSALWESYQTQGTPSWMLWLLVGGVLNAALSLVYYMRLPYLLFFRTRNPELPLPTLSLNRQIVAGLFLLLIVLAFIKPDWLTHWIAQV